MSYAFLIGVPQNKNNVLMRYRQLPKLQPKRRYAIWYHKTCTLIYA
jgi:hypothetical protein